MLCVGNLGQYDSSPFKHLNPVFILSKYIIGHLMNVVHFPAIYLLYIS